MGVRLPDFREGQVENRKKLEKCSVFQGFEREFLLFVLNTPILPFRPQMPSLIPELSQKAEKNYVSEQIFKHSLNFEPLPPLFLG